MEELYKTKEGRLVILHNIIREDNLSITEIVEAKERALNERITNQNTLISGLGIRSCAIFGENVTDVLQKIEQVKPLVALDIIKTGVTRGTPFEKELIAQYQIATP